MSFKVEEELREPVTGLFQDMNYSVFNEVRLISREIDLVAKKKSNLISIELKLNDWKKAIQQACLNLRVSNYAYVALPEYKLGKFDSRLYYEAWKTGIGVISVNGTANVIMKAQKSRRLQPSLRKEFLKSLREM